MGQSRKRVVCSCGWAGRRIESGGPCPRCAKPVDDVKRHVPKPQGQKRARMVLRVLEATSKALTSTQAANLLDRIVAQAQAQESPSDTESDSGA